MSQVRKLLQGNKIPKAKEGYKFVLDGIEYNITDDQLKEIDNKLSKIEDVQVRQELSNWTNGIKSGQGYGNMLDNTAWEGMLRDDFKKGDEKRLREKKATTGEALFRKRSWYTKHAINEALNITRSVLGKPELESSKTKVKNITLDLDFNEKDGKKYLSPTAESNFSARKRISDILAHLQAGDSSTYDYSDYNTDAISSWLDNQKWDNKYDSAKIYFDNLWTNMGKDDYEYNQDDEDLLRMFGINYNLKAVNPIKVSEGDWSGSKIGDTIVINGKNYKIAGVDSDGKFTVEEIIENSENEDEEKEVDKQEQEIEQNDQNTLDLILVKPGDRDDMDWGVIYKGVPYSYESIQPGSELGNLMERFEKNNRQLWNQGKRYNENSFIKMPSIENFSDWTVGQVLDDGTDLNQFFLNQGITSAALSHIETDSNGNRYFKYYDNFNPHGTYIPKGGNMSKENPWGIRSPYYLMIDKDGNITSTTEDYKSQNEDYSIINYAPKFKDFWNPNSSITENETVNGGYQGAFIPSTKTTQFPATFLQSVIINGKKVNVYRLNDGRLYLDDPRYKVKEHKYVTPEELYNLIKIGKKIGFKSGGTISKSKIKSFDNKFKNVIKAQNGSKGGLVQNGKDYSKWLLPGLSLIRFGINSHFQNKNYKQELQALEAGRYNEKPVTLNTPDSNNPILDRALRQVNSERSIGIKPVTSDLIANNALSNQRETQLWDRENTLLGQRSQYDHDIKNEILNIQNQNNANYINTANQNAARNAAINSAKKQAAMELTQRIAQSWENLGLEMQNNLYKDRQTMLNYNRAMEAQRLDKEYQNRFDELFPGARAVYQSLPYDEAVKYADLEDFVRQHPDYQKTYNQNIDNITDLQKARVNGMNTWLYQNGLNYSYPWWFTGWNSPIGKNKKGGRINGTTRYTLEPDEQIWVDNNKAAHAAIAKLSESTIKLLLRALK